MKKIFLYTLILIGIPFFIVEFIKIPSQKQKEIQLKYLSNIIVRVQRKNDQIEEIPLEEYVVGVVAGEMPVTFELEALKAQAVASRSYVLRRIEYNKNEPFDVTDTTSTQVYLDENKLKEKWQSKYTEYINKIKTSVNETSMEYLEYNGEVIDAMFFSTSNGYTESSEEVFQSSLPYLKSVESSWDEKVSTVFNYTTTMSLQEFYEKLSLPYKKTLTIEILTRSSSNRITKLKINNQEFKGRDVYTKLKLRSLDFKIEQVSTNINITTKGYGHGVGMSQYGAQGMAKEGYNYKDILSHYYTDTNLKKL